MKFTWFCRWMKKKSDLYLKTQFSSHSNQGKRRIHGHGCEKTQGEGVFVSRQYCRLDSNSPPEAELSPDLSCDHSLITTKWINTRVVKVKWCYVARCYWTRPVRIRDTHTSSCPPLPLLQAEAQKRVKWSLCPLCRWTILMAKWAGFSSFHCLWHNQEDHLIPGESFQTSWSM